MMRWWQRCRRYHDWIGGRCEKHRKHDGLHYAKGIWFEEGSN